MTVHCVRRFCRLSHPAHCVRRLCLLNRPPRQLQLEMKKYLFALALTACTGSDYSYSHYEAISNDGWKRTDTIGFTTGPVSHNGLYSEQLGLRTNSLFPFMSLTFIVSQEAHPSGFCRTDTVNMTLTDPDGHLLGKGISHYQYFLPLAPAPLASGDTLTISVTHNMMRSPLEGVTDVGFTIENKY